MQARPKANPSYAIARTVTLTAEEAEGRVVDELKNEGFGVLTKIDVRATLKAKLGVDVPPYVILGACNPSIAHAAIGLEPDIGLLLPCNVVIRVDPTTQTTVIEALDPVAQLGLAHNPELRALAAEAQSHLQRVVQRAAPGDEAGIVTGGRNSSA
ncbi:MAG: hypothetical protein K0S86_2002 [Geminicoccaceae bacterium]|jgi:uncharacterized protein (DUF302 family)|nr:hypothetical protein [Geminicoccaceae bacterium]